MNMPADPATTSTLLILGLLFGNGVTIAALITGFFARRKTKAEAAKTDAEAGNATASTTEALVRTSLSLLEPYTEGLTRFSNEAARLREENEHLHTQQRVLREENEALKEDQRVLREEKDELARQIKALQQRVDGIDA